MVNIQRYTKNLEIIEQFKKGQADKATLKNYSGWGGLRKAVYTPEVYKTLKKVLTLDEIQSLKQTLKSAYYTPVGIVNFIYEWLLAYGFKGGEILEPAIGNGVFIEHMPKAIKQASSITAVEIDKLASDIVSHLYPHVNLHNTGFENFQPSATFDLVIGNPPYSSQKVEDTGHSDIQGFCIHHYFVAKSMRLLKEGGLCAFVLPSFFLDNVKDHVRDIISQEGGNLLAAYRLPDNLFSDAKVTIDLVFLTKGKTPKKWLNTQPVQIGELKKPMNEYYFNNPQHVLGNLEIVDMYGRKGLACKKLGDTTQLLKAVIHQVKQERLLILANELITLDQNIRTLQARKLELLGQYKTMQAH